MSLRGRGTGPGATGSFEMLTPPEARSRLFLLAVCGGPGWHLRRGVRALPVRRGRPGAVRGASAQAHVSRRAGRSPAAMASKPDCPAAAKPRHEKSVALWGLR